MIKSLPRYSDLASLEGKKCLFKPSEGRLGDDIIEGYLYREYYKYYILHNDMRISYGSRPQGNVSEYGYRFSWIVADYGDEFISDVEYFSLCKN